MNKMYMLIGLPGSGKSTFVNQFLNDPVYHILSTDNYIDTRAQYAGKTYDEVFQDFIKAAENHLNEKLKFCVENNYNIIWDQTNLSVKNRAKKLAQIPSSYTKIAVFFDVDYKTILKRIENRPGKTIPGGVMLGMMKSVQRPTLNEGFDEIFTISG